MTTGDSRSLLSSACRPQVHHLIAYHVSDLFNYMNTQPYLEPQTLVSQSLGLQGVLCLFSAAYPFKSGLLA